MQSSSKATPIRSLNQRLENALLDNYIKIFPNQNQSEKRSYIKTGKQEP